LWNFYKIIEKDGNLKYLVRLKDRFDYDTLVLHDAADAHYSERWEKILEEYAKIENDSGVNAEKFTRSKLLVRWAKYIEEQAMIKELFFNTNVDYIKELRARRYFPARGFTSQEEYWNALNAASKKVHYHITFLESMRIQLDETKKLAKEFTNPFDQICAWISSNGINVDENVTVKRYVEIKKIIYARIKALEKSAPKRNGTARQR